ncbi:MAG: ATP-binding protein [Trueperaceae bacterium]
MREDRPDALQRMPPWLLFLLAIALTFLVAYVDLITGSEFGVSIFYLIPVTVAGLSGTRGGGYTVAALAAGTWYLTELSGPPYYTTIWAPVWNSFVRLAYFLTAAVLVREYLAKQLLTRELERLNLELETRVNNRTADLRELNEELEAINYNIAHDLRTPLRGINGYSNLLLEEYGDVLDETGREYLQRVDAATARMGALIEALLSLSRLARAEIRQQQVNITEIAFSVSTGLAEQEPGREVRVEFAEGLLARGDPSLLRTMLTNLLDNAWKFTRGVQPADVQVGGQERCGEVVFFVRDNGVGFDPEYSDKLFQPFQRLHKPGDYDGLGLGLATAHRIVNRHGGRIWAEGRVGEGTTIYFTLPESPLPPSGDYPRSERLLRG